jgi:hypothetical protein
MYRARSLLTLKRFSRHPNGHSHCGIFRFSCQAGPNSRYVQSEELLKRDAPGHWAGLKGFSRQTLTVSTKGSEASIRFANPHERDALIRQFVR